MNSTFSAELLAAWETASRILHFRVISPLFIPVASGGCHAFFAYLPDFGSPNGMLLDVTSPPEFRGDALALRFANENDMFYSAINLEIYHTFEIGAFTDLLQDAGFFGRDRPKWIDHG